MTFSGFTARKRYTETQSMLSQVSIDISSFDSSSFCEKAEIHDEKLVDALLKVLLTAWLIFLALCVLLMLLKRKGSLRNFRDRMNQA